jgi:hypothetical protein
VGEVLLWTFQPAARVAELHATGRLVGAWEYVTIEFSAPTRLVLASDYGAWNDYLVQVCLPKPPDEVTDRAARA